MLLSDLVARRDLDLRVLHAGPGALDRSVRWVYTTDLPDPGRYLGGGELVISGLVWRHTPADSERFVAAVARSGAIALAAGEAVFGEVPDDVVDACRRHDLVLFGVPERVSFGALTEVVVGTLAAARGDRLAHTLGRQRQLLDAVAAGAGLGEITERVSAATGLVCRVLTAGGAPLAGPPLPDPERDALVRAFLTAERLPVVCGRHTVFPVGPGTQRVTGWFVAAEGGPDGDVADSVAELAAVAALDRARRRDAAAVARPIAEDAITRIAAGEGDRAETRVRLRQAGVDPDGGLTVVVLRADGFPDAGIVAHQVLVDALPGVPVAVGVRDGAAVALLGRSATSAGPGGRSTVSGPVGPAAGRAAGGTDPDSTPDAAREHGSFEEPSGPGSTDSTASRPAGTAAARISAGAARGRRSRGEPSVEPDRAPDIPPEEPATWLVAALGRLAPGLGSRRLVVGIGRPAGSAALSGAFGEALHAAGMAATRSGPVAVARAGEITSHVALLAGIPDDARRAFAAQVLGPILGNDARTGGDLLDTLSTFLDESGSWSRTAERLHLHVNTVRYRIGRVQELTGRDLTHFPDRVDLYLALRAR